MSKRPSPNLPLTSRAAAARLQDKPGDGISSDASTTASTYVTAPSVLTPVPESPGVDQDENAADGVATSTAKSGGGGQPAPRWRRKNAAERQDAERRQHLAEMRAYFQEVGKPATAQGCWAMPWLC